MILLNWFKERKKKRERRQRNLLNRGFDYALGAIARGEKTPLALDAEQFGHYRNQFDVGMDKAIAYAVLHGLVKDDRVW
jgi:hypothetical protein